MKTGLLFDLDGTLLDTLEDLLDATNYALAEFGYPKRTLPELRRFVGNGAHNQIRLALGDAASPENIRRVLDVYKPYYTAHCRIKTRPYRGIPEVLARLQDQYPIAIVSNKPDSAVKELCREHFPGLYALGETADCPRKPAADMVYKAMSRLGVDKCIYIGDSEVDVLTAHNAHVPCLSVLWGFRDREDLEAAGAKYYCEDPAMLPRILEEMKNGQ